MRLEPVNIVCPACGSGNYMRHLIGKNVGHLDMKCINCNSYFNFDELYKRRIGEALKPKSQTNGDLVRQMTVEELAIFCEDGCPPGAPICNSVETIEGEAVKEHCQRCWLNWLKAPVEEEGEG